MLTRIRKIFQTDRQQASPAEAELQQRIAACVLLLEAAHADYDLSPLETARLVDTVTARFALSPAYAAELLEVANQERQDGVDLWQFTNTVNQRFSKEDKLALLEDVWGIIFADGRLERHEDHLVHKLANLLRLSHRDLIGTKLAAKARG